MSYGDAVAANIEGFLSDRMDVYEPGASGQFDTRVESEVACALAMMPTGTAPSAELRAAMLQHRTLAYDPAIQLTKGQQVEVAGHRWNPVAGTFVDATTPDLVVLYRRVDVRFER